MYFNQKCIINTINNSNLQCKSVAAPQVMDSFSSLPCFKNVYITHFKNGQTGTVKIMFLCVPAAHDVESGLVPHIVLGFPVIDSHLEETIYIYI